MKKYLFLIGKSKVFLSIFFVALLISITFVNCSKQQTAENNMLISEYYQSLNRVIAPAYDYLLTNISNKQQPSKGAFDQIVKNSLNNTIIPVTPKKLELTSAQYQKFYSDYISELKLNSTLKSHQDFIKYGSAAINKIDDQEEKKQAAFLIALGDVMNTYVTVNSERLKNIAQSADFSKYLNKDSQMFEFKRTGVVAVIVGVVVAAVVGFQNGFNNPFFGSCSSWWCDFGSGLIEGIGAAIGAYAGICPFFLGKGCPFEAES
jgi:hypothetical protein